MELVAERSLVELADVAEEHTPASTAETLMNDAEVALDESAPDQEELPPHVDEVPPVVEMGAEDVLAVPRQDLVDIPTEAPATVAEVSSEISGQAALAEEEPIPAVSEKSIVSEHESMTDATQLMLGQTSAVTEGVLISEDSIEAPNDSTTIQGGLQADVEDLKAEKNVEDHPVEAAQVPEEDIPQQSNPDARVVEAQSIKPVVASEDSVIVDGPIEEVSVSVPEQPVEIDDEPIIEEEVAIDDVVTPPVHKPLVSTAAHNPVDNLIEEAVSEPAPITEPIVEAVEEPVTADAVANDVIAEAPPTHDPFIPPATGETANDPAEQPAFIPAEAIEVTEEPVEDPAIPAGLDEAIVADPATEEPTIAEEIADDKTASILAEPVQAIEEVAIAQEEDAIKSALVYDEIVPTIAEGSVAGEVAASSSTDIAEDPEDPEESAPPAPTEDEVFAEVPADSAHGEYFVLSS